jgi:hypothetical protein
MPGDYSDKPADALTLFCGRYLEILLYGPSVEMCRVSLAETARFPQGAAQHFDVVFTEVHTRLSAYLKAKFALSPRASSAAAQKLLGQILYARFFRALFGMDKLATSLDHEAAVPDLDLKPIRKAVADLIAQLQKQ